MGITPKEADARTAELAARQHGMVTRTQLLEAGLPPSMVKSRVAGRRLLPIHRGVYRVGPLAPPRAREMAAVLACGPGAVLSHRSAATLWGILAQPDASNPVEVTVPGRDAGRRRGIRVYRVAGLDPEEVAEVDSVPVTSPARTLLDLARVVGRRALERALARAERRELTSGPEVASLLALRPGRWGSASVRTLIQGEAGPQMTRSEAEERLLVLTRKAKLPRPETNAPVGRYEVDFLWRRERVVVEVDGYAFHSSRTRFEGDRRRDAELAARGFRVIRVTWRQITREPEEVLVRLAQALVR